LLDDLYEWSAPAKVSGMVLAGGVMSLLGITMFYFRIPFFGLVVLSPDLAPLVTVLWVAGMANAVNLIDGLDGLAAGTVAIAAGAFFLYAQRLNDAGLLAEGSISPMVSVIVLGMCVGFLPHNFHPARIFMGDCGALLLGLLMAASTIVVGGRASEPFSGQTYFFFAPLFIPLFILGVPILDTAFAIVRRATRRAGVATADKDHLHHRLMRLGHGHRRSVLILWTWTAILSGFVLYPTFAKEGDAIVPFGVAALGLALYMLLHPGVRRARADDR
jgi:UDP-GlcNAc:undecaprenyl-phosphate GlcNAc-1-phosphate transferase